MPHRVHSLLDLPPLDSGVLLPDSVPAVGFEPTRPEGHQVLSLARLPFHHTGVVQGYAIPPCEGPTYYLK